MSFVESQKFNIESAKAREESVMLMNFFPGKTVSYVDMMLIFMFNFILHYM